MKRTSESDTHHCKTLCDLETEMNNCPTLSAPGVDGLTGLFPPPALSALLSKSTARARSLRRARALDSARDSSSSQRLRKRSTRPRRRSTSTRSAWETQKMSGNQGNDADACNLDVRASSDSIKRLETRLIQNEQWPAAVKEESQTWARLARTRCRGVRSWSIGAYFCIPAAGRPTLHSAAAAAASRLPIGGYNENYDDNTMGGMGCLSEQQ